MNCANKSTYTHFITGDLHGQLEDLLLIFYKVRNQSSKILTFHKFWNNSDSEPQPRMFTNLQKKSG